MPKAYSYDFRCRVIEAIELDGMPKTEASEVFNVSRNTINLWFQLRAETGDLHPRPHNHQGYGHKVTDWEAFRAFVKAHPDQCQAKLAALWPGEINDRTISRALKRINMTRKKRCDPASLCGARERAQRQIPMAIESETPKSGLTSDNN